MDWRDDINDEFMPEQLGLGKPSDYTRRQLYDLCWHERIINKHQKEVIRKMKHSARHMTYSAWAFMVAIIVIAFVLEVLK